MLKPALQGVDRGRAKLKLRVVDVKALPSRDSIAFVSQSASPATYAWVKVDGVQNYESRLADFAHLQNYVCRFENRRVVTHNFSRLPPKKVEVRMNISRTVVNNSTGKISQPQT